MAGKAATVDRITKRMQYGTQSDYKHTHMGDIGPYSVQSYVLVIWSTKWVVVRKLLIVLQNGVKTSSTNRGCL